MSSLHFILLDLLLKSTAILIVAGLCTFALRRASAANRHAVWCAAFAALVLLPLTKIATPRWKLQPPAPAPVQLIVPPAVSTPAQPITSEIPMAAPIAHWRLPEPVVLVSSAWAAGAAGIFCFWLLGVVQLARLRRRSTPVTDPRLVTSCERVAAGLRVRRTIELRALEGAAVPVTWGFWRQVVLVPADAAGWPAPRLEAALRHELAHVARGDYLTRTLALLACAFYWPNPLAWLGLRRLRREQEHACDDLVLKAGTPSDSYATLLLEAARQLRGAALLPAGAVPMARPTTLEGRVLAIIDESRDRRPAGWLTRWLAGAGVALSAVLGCAAQLLAAETPATIAAAGKLIEIETKFVEIAPEVAQRKEFAPWFAKNAASPVVLSSERYAEAIRALSAQRGVEILAAPRVTARSGQHASIKTGAQVPYPTDWVKGPNGWEAKGMEGRNVGVEIELEPALAADGATVSLDLQPSSTEFLGYFDQDAQKWYGAPSRHPSVTDLAEAQAKVPAGVIANPMFAVRKAAAKVSLTPGQAAVISRLEPAPPGPPLTNGYAAKSNLLVFVSARVLEDSPPAATAPAAPTALDRAAKIIIPRLEFREATLRESIDFLRQKSATLDPEKKGVNFVLNPPAGELPRITLSLTNIPVSEAARYVAKLAGLGVTGDRDAIVIEAERAGALTFAGTGTLILAGSKHETDLTINGGTLNLAANPEPQGAAYQKARELIIPKLEFREASLREAIDFLRQKGVTLDSEHKGVNLVLDPSAGETPRITISLTNVPLSEALRYVAKLAGLGLTFDREAILIGPAAAGMADRVAKPGAESAAAKKAQSLILPKLEFRDATVREAVDYFRAKALALDRDKKGLNIVIAPGVNADLKLTLSLTNASIWEALGYVAKLASLELGGDDTALVVHPRP